MEIVGYADRLRAQPGEKVSFKVSCRASSFRAQLVRLIHGDDNPDGPGSKIDDLDSAANGEYPGRIQELHPGSFVSVPDDPLLHLDGSFTIQAWIYPTTVGKRLQGVVTKWDCNNDIGYGLFVDEEGAVSLRIGNGETVDAVSTGVAMRDAKWYFAAGVYDADEGSIRVYQTPLDHWPLQDTAAEGGGSASEGPGKTGAALVIGGSSRGDGTGFGTVGCLYNGKIDNPAIFARGLGPDEIAALRNGGSSPAGDSALVAAWDFGRDFSTSTVTDSSPNGLHGEALNMPGRAVTGHNWNGGTMDFKQAPDQYAAIRFNDDDLDDARWDTDFEYTVPEDLKSAMYAFRLTTDDAEDYIPFAVRPRTGESTAKIAFLLGTYTFLAYANEHLANNPVLIEYLDGKGMDVPFPVLPQEHYMVDNKLGGLYDLHTDGSGICYSSSRKPIVNFRPNNKQRTVGAGMGAPVLLSADLHQMDWMESQGFDFDVITDEDIHFDGLDLLSGYNVVMSDAHPEYWTEDMLIALEAYLNAGGRFMYLGGNGLYWITSVDPDRPHVIEVRRWNGTGSWRTDFAESHHSTTGEPGGLWRFRGWAPQRLVGVGMTAQGGSGINSAYRRLPDSFDPRAAFIFEGIGDDELIGDFDTLNLGWGAAGYEMDRADPALGTPDHALVVATAPAFADSFH
ncbi:MAG: LamG domain-containing protein, partial [Acidimicrobiia bacterium]|nr:LamG domain-containing protein [Acidimicrobiia bacterium]